MNPEISSWYKLWRVNVMIKNVHSLWPYNPTAIYPDNIIRKDYCTGILLSLPQPSIIPKTESNLEVDQLHIA